MAKTRIAIVGCGLVGNILGLALHAAGKNNPSLRDIEVAGHDKDQLALKKAETVHAIDKGNWNLPATCENAALVLITIPQDGLETTLRSIGNDLPSGAIVMSIGGAIQTALVMAQKYLPADVAFVATSLIFHPDRVAASVTPEGATADMLDQAIWTLTPRNGTTPDQTDIIASFVVNLNAVPVFMDARERDGLSLSVDVVPSLLSSALMLAVSNDGAWRERQWLAGAEFADATKQAESAQRVMQQVMGQREAAVHWLNQAMLQMMALRDAIDDGDQDALQTQLTQAAQKREQWLADWRKGRDDGRVQQYKAPSVLGAFIGQNLAQRLQGDKKK